MKHSTFLLTILCIISCMGCNKIKTQDEVKFKGVSLNQQFEQVRMLLEQQGCDFTIDGNVWAQQFGLTPFNAYLYDKQCECAMMKSLKGGVESICGCFASDKYSSEQLNQLFLTISEDFKNTYGDCEIVEYDGLIWYQYNAKQGHVSIQQRTKDDKSVTIGYFAL